MYKYMEKTDRLVAKRYDDSGNFIQSFIIPTEKYPLKNNDFKIFSSKNTEELKDEKIIDIINTIKWKMGFCYTCHDELYSALKKKGINCKYYVGWLVKADFPIHHAWIVIEDKYLIDLSEDSFVYYQNLARMYTEDEYNAMTLDEQRKIILSYAQASKQWKNSERCYPLGHIVYDSIKYIGCESTATEGKLEFNMLMDKFPNHEAYKNVDKNGKNKLNKMLEEQGYYK